MIITISWQIGIDGERVERWPASGWACRWSTAR